MNLWKVNIRLIENNTQLLFRYSSMSYQVDLINNSPTPLPYYWNILNPAYANLDFASWKQIETSKIKLSTNVTSKKKTEPEMDYGNLLHTKFHRT